MYIKPVCEVVPLLEPSLMSEKSLANTCNLELSTLLFTIQHSLTRLCEDTCYYFTSSSLALPGTGSALQFLRYHIRCMFVTTHELLTPLWSPKLPVIFMLHIIMHALCHDFIVKLGECSYMVCHFA